MNQHFQMTGWGMRNHRFFSLPFPSNPAKKETEHPHSFVTDEQCQLKPSLHPNGSWQLHVLTRINGNPSPDWTGVFVNSG
jgi:hypothetical protein